MIMLLERKIHDRAFMRLILKWLKAGILEKDGSRISPYTGCPQGEVISLVISNVYLHYSLDRWFVHQVRPCCKGETMIVRYADDFVCACCGITKKQLENAKIDENTKLPDYL